MNFIFWIVYNPLEHSTHTSNGPYEEVDKFMSKSLEFIFRAISVLEYINEQSLFFNSQEVIGQKTGSQLKNNSISVFRTSEVPVLKVLNKMSFWAKAEEQ